MGLKYRGKPSLSNADEMSPESVKWASNPKTFERQIEVVFKGQKAEERPPLLKNWEAYLAHLPRREGEEDPTNPLILYQCPYYVGKEDLDRFANSLVSPPVGAVRSIVAPPGAGKSAAVLPAFLQMHKSKLLPAEVPRMYIYMPFYNNAKRRHRAPDFLSSFLDLIRLQRLQFYLGQAYMLCCFDLMLHGEYYRWWGQLFNWFCRAFFNWAFYSSRVDDLWQHSVQQLVKQAVGDGRILVHVDEHFAMSTNPDFRSGALGVLAQAQSNCLVVTTYTEVTFEFQTRRSDISRYFVALPPLQSLEALSENDNWKLKGGAAEKFRTRDNSAIALSILFSMLVQGMGPKWLHVSPEKLSVNKVYGKQSLRDFYQKWNKARCSNADDGLKICCQCCREMVMQYMANASPPQEEQTSLVFRLIGGIPINSSDEVLQTSNMSLHSVVGFEEIITKPLVEMLKIKGKGGTVWEKGRTMLLEHIEKRSHLLNVDKVLECAFICAFDLPNSAFHERPTQWRCGQLFLKKGQGQEVVVRTEEFRELKKNELVYTDEPCHPYVDLWMKTGEKELTLMQVTGSRVWTRVSQKCKDLEKALDLLNESQNH